MTERAIEDTIRVHRIPEDLLVHTGHTDEGSDRTYSIRSGVSAYERDLRQSSSERGDELDPQQGKFELSQFERNLNLNINSTISQDQTAGADQNAATLLLVFAQRLAKQQEISFAGSMEDSDNLPTNLASWSRRPGASNRLDDQGGTQSKERRSASPSIIDKRIMDAHFHMSDFDTASYSSFPSASSRDRPEVAIQRYSTLAPASQIQRPIYNVGANDLTPVPGGRYVPTQDRYMERYERPNTAPDTGDDYLHHPTTTAPPAHGDPFSRSGPENDQESASNPYKRFQEQALSATDADLRDMQKVFSNLSTDDRAKIAASELDPVAYYFAHLKDGCGERERVYAQSSSIRESLEHSNNIVAPRSGKYLDESEEKTVSEQLHNLQQHVSPREKIELLEQPVLLNSQSRRTDLSVCSPPGKNALESNPATQDSFSVVSSPNPELSQTLASSVTAPGMPEGYETDRSSIISDSTPVSTKMRYFQNQASDASITLKKGPKSFLPILASRQHRHSSPLKSATSHGSRYARNTDTGKEFDSLEDRIGKITKESEQEQWIPSQISSSSTQARPGSRKPLISPEVPSKDDPKRIKTPKHASAEATKPTTPTHRDTPPGAPGPTETSSDLMIIRLLQERIAKLQQEKLKLPATKLEGEQSSRIQIIYHVTCHGDNTTNSFLDEPLKSGDGSDQTFHLQGHKIFPSNRDLFIERQRGALAFIAWKDLECCKPIKSPGDKADEGILLRGAIQPTSKLFQEAFESLIKKFPTELKDFPAFKVGTTIEAPYLFYFHKRSLMSGLKDIPEKHLSQIHLFRQYVDDSYGEEFARADDLISKANITAEYLPYLFEPGKVIVKRQGDYYLGYEQSKWPCFATAKAPSAIQFDGNRARPPKEFLEVVGRCWEFDGAFVKNFVPLEVKFDDDPKIVMKPIKALNVFPLRFAEPRIETEMRRSGAIFWSCRFRRYVSYSDNVDSSREFKQKSESRYMVDLGTYQKMHQQNIHKKERRESANDLPEKLDLSREEMEAEDPPEGSFLLLLPRTVRGFNMQVKKWVELEVDRISEVEWNKEAFQSLVVDPPVKELITALVTNQLASEKATDLMDGKGTGLIILLHGGPGTGKTLTAESVAEFAEKPLYRVTCGDIGTSAESVEEYLKTILLLGKTWKCVVLLDEADVFLEQRSLRDLQRNALVSVFLRVLEYYDGILILTSNRVGTFDEAFKSRIQLALHYESLKEWQRRSIWENFIKRLEGFDSSNSFSTASENVSVTRKDTIQESSVSKGLALDFGVDTVNLRKYLNDLAHQEMNGRQIRNAITTARQLALYKREMMDYNHLKHVIEVAGKFDRYLFELHEQVDDNQIAHDDGIR